MSKWNIEVPTSEYYGPLPANPRGVQSRDIEPLIRELKDTQEIAIDTETTGLTTWQDFPLYWSVAWGNRRATIHAGHLHDFREVFADPRKRWIFANAKYDAHMIANEGLPMAGKFLCTQVMHSLLYEERSHALKDMAKHLLGWRWSDFQDTFGKIRKGFSPTELIRKAESENFPLLVEYAANDAWGTMGCYRDLKGKLQDSRTHSLFRDKPPYIETLDDLFEKIEAPFTKVLWKNERNGILVDMPYLARIEPEARKEIDDVEREMTNLAGWVINPKSNHDLRRYFFEQCKYKPLKMSAGGNSGVRVESVDISFIDYCIETYGDKVAVALKRHRNLSKLYGTYIAGISELINPKTCRIHTRFNQDIARTGRLSSADPNLQNLPNVDKDKWKIRGAFIAPPGYSLIVADYDQLEMRLLACASLEQDMIDIFLRKWDIHMGNAFMMVGIPYEELKAAKETDKLVKLGKLPESALTSRVLECLAARAAAKNIGFGLNYGMGAAKLAADLGITRQEAEAKIALYKRTYPAVTRFYAEAVMETEQTGYAFTILGRRRNLPDISSSRKDERARAERQCVNVPIQGSAADVIKCAQIALDKADLAQRFDCTSQLQVHDELVHQCRDEYVDQAMAEIRDYMEHPFIYDLAVPLTVSIAKGQSWLSK